MFGQQSLKWAEISINRDQVTPIFLELSFVYQGDSDLALLRRFQMFLMSKVSPRSWVIINWRAPFSHPRKPLEDTRSIHAVIAKSILDHPVRVCSRFSKVETNFDANSLLFHVLRAKMRMSARGTISKRAGQKVTTVHASHSSAASDTATNFRPIHDLTNGCAYHAYHFHQYLNFTFFTATTVLELFDHPLYVNKGLNNRFTMKSGYSLWGGYNHLEVSHTCTCRV